MNTGVLETNTMNELTDFSMLFVDDHPLFREGLVLALHQRAPGICVHAVATVAEARSALMRDPLRWDLVLVDYNLRDESGLTAAIRLRRDFPDIACGLMSGSEDPGLNERARAADLAAFIPKSLEVGALLEAIKVLAQGETYFSAAIAAKRVLDLTARQLEIVELAGRGASNKEIAQVLGIAPHTVKNHFAQIFEKLGAGNRAQAVSIARRTDPDDESIS